MKMSYKETLSLIKKGLRGLMTVLLLLASLLLSGCSFVDDDFWLTYPSDYEGVELWLDAGSGVGLDPGTGGVISWRDQSRNKLYFHYSSMPTLTTDSGKPVIHFITPQYLTSTTGIDVSNKMTLFFVAYIIGSTGGIIGSPASSFSINPNGSSTFDIYPAPVSMGLAIFNDTMRMFEMQINAPSVKIVINDGYSSNSANGLNSFSLSYPINIGADFSNAVCEIRLAEMIICSDKCSEQSIDNIRNYLKEKYGIGN
jgi:hypothetical protein